MFTQDFKDRCLCSLVISLHPWILKFKKSISNSDSTNPTSTTKKKLLKEIIVVDFENNRESTKIPCGKLQVFSLFQLLLGSRNQFLEFWLMKDSQWNFLLPLLLVEFQMLPETPSSFQWTTTILLVATVYLYSLLCLTFSCLIQVTFSLSILRIISSLLSYQTQFCYLHLVFPFTLDLVC